MSKEPSSKHSAVQNYTGCTKHTTPDQIPVTHATRENPDLSNALSLSEVLAVDIIDDEAVRPPQLTVLLLPLLPLPLQTLQTLRCPAVRGSVPVVDTVDHDTTDSFTIRSTIATDVDVVVVVWGVMMMMETCTFPLPYRSAFCTSVMVHHSTRAFFLLSRSNNASLVLLYLLATSTHFDCRQTGRCDTERGRQ